MLKNIKIGLLVVASALSLNTFAAPMNYEIDPTHTSVVVSWNHFGFSNPTATFSEVTGTIIYDAASPADSSVSVSIPVKTVDTYVPKLTEEFLAAEYFDTATYPNATFKSTKVVATGDKTLDITGDLTIKGVTKSVVLNATLNGMGEHPMTKKQAIGFNALTTIKRADFGLAKYVPYVSDNVTIQISTEAQVK